MEARRARGVSRVRPTGGTRRFAGEMLAVASLRPVESDWMRARNPDGQYTQKVPMHGFEVTNAPVFAASDGRPTRRRKSTAVARNSSHGRLGCRRRRENSELVCRGSTPEY
jgi:hypothetical protein